MSAIRRKARKVKSDLLLTADLLSVRILKYSFKLGKPKDVMFEVASSLEDGTGAQLHKQGSVYCLSRALRSAFVSSPLKSVEIQHGDNFLSDNEVRRHIEDINKALLKTDTPHIAKYSKGVSLKGIPRIDLPRVLAALALSRLLSRPTTFLLSQAFGYLGPKDKLLYLEFGEILSRGLNFQIPLSRDEVSIQTHLRVSTVNPISDRYLPESYYLDFLQMVTRKLDAENKPYRIIVHTDFNDSMVDGSDVKWSANPETIEYWKVIGITDPSGNLNLHTMQSAKKILNSITTEFADVEILQNSSPIEAWKEMGRADYLQISNSSFSFLGAIMNYRAAIYAPNNDLISVPGWKFL